MKRKKGFFYIVGCGALAAAMLSGCAEDESFSTSRSDVLSFSVDSVSLDTTFSNVPTPTASFWVYNRAGKGLRCSSVRLENGNQSGFRVNVDGTYLGETAGYQTQDVEVRKGDSIRVFIELTSHTQHQDTPRKVEDNLVFTLESGVQQKMNLYAYSWDALMMRNARISRDSLLQSAKPVVVYGGIRVDSMATLTIAPGTQLYFHENAGLQVVDSAKVQIYNSQITNCLKHPLYVEGGDVEVNGCTIAQFYPFDGRRESAIGFASPLPRFEVRNSLVTGYHDDEVVWEAPKEEDAFNFLFDHCVLRTEKMQGDDSLKFTHVVYEDVKDTTMYGEKHFVLFDTDNLKYDFRLRKESAAIGKADPATSLPVDRNGLRRKETPDAGCYESEYENGEEE